MRRGLVGVGVASLLVTGLVAAPPGAAQTPQAQVAAVTPAPNPVIDETCGLDATLILDASGSIQSAGAVNTVRNAGRDLTAALKDTNSTLRITQFGTFSGQLSSRVPVNASTTGSGGALSQALNNYYTPPPPRPAGVNIYNGNTIQNNALTWTNWEDGIKGIDTPELALFITDGDPTAYNVNATRTNVNTSSTGTALDNAITQANALKARGTRMLVVGVGNGLTSTSSQDRLKKISGPVLEKSAAALAGKTINQVDAVAFTDFAALGAFLRSVVTSLCGNSVTVQKLAQSSSGADYLPATGWDVTVQPTVQGGFSWVDPTGPDNSAQTRATSGTQGTAAFQWKPKAASQKATVKVSEAVKSEFTADRWRCEIKAEDGTTTSAEGTLSNQDPSFFFDMNPSDVASCQLYNDFDYAPGLQVTKEAKDDPVRGNGNGWNQEYTFRVTNTGNTPLTIAKPVDPQCTSISAPSGPGAPGALPPGESWTYTCQAKIGPVATVTTPLDHKNTVTVIGIDPNGTQVSGTADETVDVKTPAVHLEKTAKKAGTDVVIPDGGNVPAGTRVTYVYTVTNAGNDVLSLNRAAAVTDDSCSPVTYISGDTGDDQKLGLGEVWIYECTKVLNPPSTVSSVTNLATVTAKWSNPQDRPQNDGAVTGRDHMTINVDRAANLRIVKVTNPAATDQDFPFTVSGQGVPVGDQSFDLNTGSGAPPASRSISLDGPDGNGSQYTITESAVTGWDLTDLVCDKAPDSVTGGQVKITIRPEEDVTCTFTNQRRPTLTVTKQTNPGGSPAEFPFTGSAGLEPTFTLTDGTSRTFSNLVPGPYDVTEGIAPAGWELDSILCDQPHTVTGAKVSLTLGYGDAAECTFVNGQLPPATLTVLKDDEPSTWRPDFDFKASGTGLVDPGQLSSSDFTLGLGASKTFTVRPLSTGDTYTVTEKAQPTPPAGESGFALTSLECVINGDTGNPVAGNTGTGVVEVDLAPGDSAVCTYTNQQLPRLTIVKNAVNAENATDDTDFPFTTLALDPSSFFLQNGASQVFTDVPPGLDFQVTELTPVDWTLTSLVCTGQGAQGVTADVASGAVLPNAEFDYGADIVCTYVNTKVPPKAYLFVLKSTDPQDAPGSFDFTAKGPDLDEQFPLTGGDYQGFEVAPGAGGQDYTVTEAVKDGWELTDAQCFLSSNPGNPVSGPAPRSVTVKIKAGEVAVCAFDNQKLGTLTIDKVTDVPSATEFPFTATGVTPDNFKLTGSGAPRVYQDIPADTEISITEQVPTDAPDRWELSRIQCDGSKTAPVINGATATVKVGAGEDVECTYSDAKVPAATVEIVKAADPADGTSFPFSAQGQDSGSVKPADETFNLAPDGGPAVKTLTVYPRAAGETFTFTEGQLPTNWNLDDITCEDAGKQVGTADLGARKIDVNVDPGDTITCTFTNRKDATLTVVKEAPDDPSVDFDFAWTTTPGTFQLRDQQSRTAEGLDAGTYTVQETDLPADWYLDGPQGAHPTCIGGENPVDYAPELGATVDLKPGEDVVCTFADFFEYDPQITLVKTPDREVVLTGQSVTYTYVVTNSGNVALTPAGNLDDVVTDDQCSPVTYDSGGTPPTMAPGDTWTFTCTVVAMTPAKATNKAEATMQGPDEPVTATDTVTVEVLVPELSLRKKVDQPIVYPGTDVTYTYVATNSGTAPFEAPQGATSRDDWLSDDKCSPVTYVSGDTNDDSVMEPGEAWLYTCGSPISTDTVNEGTFTATPFVGKQTGPQMQATATAEVDVIRKGIAITKTPSAPGGVVKDGTLLVPVGTEVTYTYEVTSGTATVPMDVLDVTDNKCAPVQYQSGDTSDDGMVDPGETWIYTCKSAFAGVSTVTNTVVVTALEPILGGIAEDSDQAAVRSYKGSIAIKKSPSSELVPKGTPVTYTYTALNDGTVDLTDVTVTDDKCAPVTYVSGDDGDGVMQPGEQWTFRCVSSLNDDVTNVAEATGTTPGGGKVTDSTSVTVLVVGGRLNPAIAVTKSPSATQVEEGGKVTYRYEVTNVGTMPLANIRMGDDKCAPVTYVSGDDNGDGLLTSSASGEGWPDETWIYTCSTKITKKTTNTVTATGSPWNAGQVVGTDVSATAKATVSVSKVLPINVDPVKKCKGGTCVKASKTNKYGTLKYRTACRPVGRAAAGEVSYCRTRVTKNGAVKVKAFGYRKVKVTVWITAVPKPKYKNTWTRNTWQRTWVIRP